MKKKVNFLPRLANKIAEGPEEDHSRSVLWNEVKVGDLTTVYIMGETGSRDTCTIHVPNENFELDNGSEHSDSSSKEHKIQLHIFLPTLQ